MKQKYLFTICLATLMLPMTQAYSQSNELQLGKPRTTSYLNSPLVLEVPVKAASGQRLAVPCVTGVEINGQSRTNAVKKYAFWRTGAESGVIQLRDEQWVKQSPVQVNLEFGCTQAKKASFELAVAAAPVIPMNAVAATPLKNKKTSKTKKSTRHKKPTATSTKTTVTDAATSSSPDASKTAAKADSAKTAAPNPKATSTTADKSTEEGVDASVLLDRVQNMSRPSQR